jgi:hypothetical protein
MASDAADELIAEELRIAILQVLYWARKGKPFRGASGKMLMDTFGFEFINQIEPVMRSLRERDFIEMTEREFVITIKGVEHLENHFPGSEPPQFGDIPPTDEPPTDDPNDKSRIPRKPFPASGSAAAALPLPPKEET